MMRQHGPLIVTGDAFPITAVPVRPRKKEADALTNDSASRARSPAEPHLAGSFSTRSASTT
jgi:hypothetical protein